MGLWDGISNVLSGGGRDDVNDGYDEANKYMDPYRRGGAEDYNHMRDYSNQWEQRLGKHGDAGNWMYDHMNQSPNEYYDTIMKGYSESPDAKYRQEQALRASNAAGSA